LKAPNPNFAKRRKSMLARLKVRTQLLVLIGTSLFLFLAAVVIAVMAPGRSPALPLKGG